ncbi:class I SAM-dependent methyltransferase [Pseudoalteromonas sp. SMS1]|uniref:class I SAM-dependent methyltransferase n=1 Tax=Pseudoalteromonas sp. SMS1 TaxID=2908894 RepID=UPI001F2BF461|nr:class I SAM-dependent methyltransferase [Pseudoalteromonas sp. SMS1]MCF2856158.1 class I SAM-dependent methyltransferase [Pseudoalteromonas sp. SMS1]
MSESTYQYYRNHAKEFADATLNVNMQPLYTPFLNALPNKKMELLHLLDAGCGSGRDALAFKELGYQVSAMDACLELVELATSLLGQPVKHRYFESIDENGQYDGIWACASLLHVMQSNLPDVFKRLERALKSKGVLYASFKYGQGERVQGGRHFTDLDEQGLKALITSTPSLSMIQTWVTQDRRPGRENEHWLNCLLRKD